MKILNKALLASAIERRMENDLTLCNVGGASVLVWQDGSTVYKKNFGAGVTDNTLFRLASMTKPITAVAVMILVDRGLLSLEDTVDKFYPKFSVLKVIENDSVVDIESKIAVAHLLSHTSGVGSGIAERYASKRMTKADIADVEHFTEFISAQPLSFRPGTKQEYSGVFAFSILTGIIQKISGMPYSEFLQKEIFEPCGMCDTTFEPTEEQWGRIITMHNKEDGRNTVGQTFDGCVFGGFPAKNYLGGAGLISSLSDYLNFAQMLYNGGVYEGKRIISENAVKEIGTLRFPSKATEGWGLGVRVINSDPANVLPAGTFGWSGAYGTHFWIDPVNRIIGIYMKNSKYDGGSGAITSRNFEIDVYSAI